MNRVLPLCLVALACADRRTELDNPVTLLAPPEASRVTRAHGDFVRVGFMMDAHGPDAIELRTSRDGATWTDWQKPVIVFAEGEAFAGHVDAPEGSTHFEYRLTDPSRPPAWLQLEEVEALGEPAAPLEPLEAEKPTGVATRTDALAPFPTIRPRSAWGGRARPPAAR